MLCMKDAVFLADGEAVCEVAEERTAGAKPRSFSFDFCLLDKPESLVLKAAVRTDGGRNSYGDISLVYENEMIVEGKLYMPDLLEKTSYKQYADRRDFSEVIFPDGIREIGFSSFSGTSLKRLVVPGSVKLIDAWAFSHCPDLEEVIIEEGVEELREAAFYDCPSLVSVTLPSSLVTIPKDNALFNENKESRVFYCPEGSFCYEKAKGKGFRTIGTDR